MHKWLQHQRSAANGIKSHARGPWHVGGKLWLSSDPQVRCQPTLTFELDCQTEQRARNAAHSVCLHWTATCVTVQLHDHAIKTKKMLWRSATNGIKSPAQERWHVGEIVIVQWPTLNDIQIGLWNQTKSTHYSSLHLSALDRRVPTYHHLFVVVRVKEHFRW